MKNSKPVFHLSDFLWDVWCIASIIGIWPRFIEPNLLDVNKLILKIPGLPDDLEGLKIAQFSDLHLNDHIPDFFLKKLARKIMDAQPDVIVFSGDFLCYAKTDKLERLKAFLNTLSAPYGCYAILGNHDYAQCVSLNNKGEYDILKNEGSMIKRGFSRLLKVPTLAKKSTADALAVPLNTPLTTMLKETPFTLLHNTTVTVPVKNTFLNICGLGEYLLGRTNPKEAFASYNREYPGIVLLHNPDGIPLLADYPGEIILCGHVHGGQINLPWMWKRFTLLENMEFFKGYKQYKGKKAYISRGISGVMPFRWRARPEILLITLEAAV